MKFEIDQSGRIEETNRDTIIGLVSQKKAFTVKIPAKVKRQLLEIFRRRGRSRAFPMVIFGVVVGIVAKKSKLDVTDLDIDIEYPGHEQLIQNLIASVVDKEITCQFKSIGRRSKAHYVAYGVFMKKRKADVTLGLGEILRYFGIKKTEIPIQGLKSGYTPAYISGDSPPARSSILIS